jgi:hypothetical protein
MVKSFAGGVLVGAVIVAACWVGVSFFGPRAVGPQTAAPTPQTTAGVRFPDGSVSFYWKFKGAMNVAHRDGVTAVDFHPGCIVVRFKEGPVERGQVLLLDQIEDPHWIHRPEKQ